MRTRILLAITSLLAALILAAPGCVTTTTGPGGIVAMPDQPVPIATANRDRPSHAPRATPKEIVDPCSERMEDIVGTLYLYHVLHQRLPDNLEDLRSVADITVDLNFTCPASGKPYIYNPTGLAAPGGGGLRLILYDATPAHNGHRWAVMAGLGTNKQNQTFLKAFTVNLSEKDFSTYKPLPHADPPGAGTPADPQVKGQGVAAPVGQP